MSDKHEITWSNLSQDAGTAVVNITLAKGVATADRDASTEVVSGARVNSIYLEFHFSAAQTGNVNVIHWQIGSRPEVGGLSSPNTYYNDDRAYIFKRGMEMIPTNVSTVFKRIFVVRIPRVYHRIKMGQQIILSYQASSTQTINACGIAIYKSYQ